MTGEIEMLPHRLFAWVFLCALFILPRCLPAAPPGVQRQLLLAARQGSISRARFLLAKGANVNVRNGKVGAASGGGEMSPLMEAAKAGRTKMVKFLIAKGANVKATEGAGDFTALMYASNYGCVKALLDAGADPNDSNVDGESVLTQWLDKGDAKSEKIIRLLVDRGANVNCGYENGETGLQAAVEAGNLSVVRLLLKKGAKVNAKEEGDETALTIARRIKRNDLISLLEQAGARQ